MHRDPLTMFITCRPAISVCTEHGREYAEGDRCPECLAHERRMEEILRERDARLYTDGIIEPLMGVDSLERMPGDGRGGVPPCWDTRNDVGQGCAIVGIVLIAFGAALLFGVAWLLGARIIGGR